MPKEVNWEELYNQRGGGETLNEPTDPSLGESLNEYESEDDIINKKKQQEEEDAAAAKEEQQSTDFNLDLYEAGLAWQDAQGAPSVDRGLGPHELKEKYDYGRTYSEFIDQGETRGELQGTGEKLRRGIAKGLANAGSVVLGGTVGVAAGLHEWIKTGDVDGLWNNEFSHQIDEWNEELGGKLAHYYTRAEREAGFWQRIGTANFLTDQLINGFSFLAGAVLTEMIYTGVGAMVGGIPGAAAGFTLGATRIAGMLTKMKRVHKAATATKVGKKVNATLRSDALWGGARSLRAMATSANYEAGLESRDHYNQMHEWLTARELERVKKERGEDAELTDNEIAAIHDEAVKSSNRVYAAGIALIGGSNVLMFPKLFGPGIKSQIAMRDMFRKLTPSFMHGTGIRVGTEGGKQVAQAAYKTNILGKIGVPQKAQEVINKGFGYAGAIGKPFVREGLEESGQRMIKAIEYDYTRQKYGPKGLTLTGNYGEAFSRAFYDAFQTPEGQSEFFIGGLMGVLGIPGMGGNVIAAQGAVRSQRDRYKLQDLTAELYNKGHIEGGVTEHLKANADLLTELYNIQPLIDEAILAGDVNTAKDLQEDQIFSFIKSKVKTGQFQDILDLSDSIKDMDVNQFESAMGYKPGQFTQEELEARKNKTAANLVNKAKKIRESFIKAESLLNFNEKSLEDMTNPRKTHMVEWVAHKLSTLDRISEREATMISELGDMTGARITDDKKTGAKVLTYVDEKGEEKSFTIGGFTSDTLAQRYHAIKKTLDEDAKLPELERMDADQRAILEGELQKIETVANSLGGPIDIADLSQEELELVNEMIPSLKKLESEDPVKSVQNQKNIMQIIKDLRRLRAKRQGFIASLNDFLSKGSDGILAENVQLDKDIEELRKEGSLENILTPHAKELFARFGPGVKFIVGDNTYTFNENGVLVNENGVPVDSSILEGISEENIISPERQKARKILAAIDALKKEKRDEADKLVSDIHALQLRYDKLVREIAQVGAQQELDLGPEFSNMQQIVELRKDLQRQADDVKRFIDERVREKEELLDQIKHFDELIERYYDPQKGILDIDFESRSKREQANINRLSAQLGLPQDMSLKGAKFYAQDIRDSLADWAQIHMETMNTLKQSLVELENRKSSIEKMILDRVRKIKKFKNLPILKVNSFDELFNMLVNSIDTESIREQAKKEPELAAALDALIALESYSDYRDAVSANPEIFDIFKDKLNILDAVENAFNNATLLRQEFNATREEIEEAKLVLESLQEQDRSDLAAQLIDAIRFQQSYEDIVNKLGPLEDLAFEIDQRNDPEIVITDEQKVHEDPPSHGEYGYLTDKDSKERDKILRPDLSIPGFGKTAGDLATANSILETIDEQIAAETDANKKAQLEAVKKVALAQRRFFKVTQKLRSKKSEEKHGKLEDLRLMVVTKERIPKSLEKDLENTFYDAKEEKFILDDRTVTDPNIKDIKVVLTDSNGTPIRTADGDAIFTSLMTPALTNEKVGDRFTNKFDVNSVEASNNWLARRTELIQNEKNELLHISDTSRGYGNLVYDEYGQLKLFNVQGRAVEEGTELKNAPLIIADKDQITLGNTTFQVPPGFAYLDLWGHIAPVIPRFLNTSEIDNIVNLLRKFEQNIATLAQQTKSKRAHVLEEARTHEMDGHDILRALRSMVFFGGITKEYDPQYRFFFDKDGWYFGEDGFISHEELRTGEPTQLKALKQFLSTKYHQINKLEVDNSDNQTFTLPIINNDLTVNKENTRTYANYKEYLFAEREDGSEAPALTPMPPINDSEGAVEFNYVYLMFNKDKADTEINPEKEETEKVEDLPFADDTDVEHTPKQKASITMTKNAIATAKKWKKGVKGLTIDVTSVSGEKMTIGVGKYKLDAFYFGLYQQSSKREDALKNVKRADYLAEIDALFAEYQSEARDLTFPQWIESIGERFVETKEKPKNPGKKIKKRNESIEEEAVPVSVGITIEGTKVKLQKKPLEGDLNFLYKYKKKWESTKEKIKEDGELFFDEQTHLEEGTSNIILHKDGVVIGHLLFDNDNVIHGVEIGEPFRGNKLSTLLYKKAQEFIEKSTWGRKGTILKSDRSISKEAEYTWKSLVKKGLAKKTQSKPFPQYQMLPTKKSNIVNKVKSRGKINLKKPKSKNMRLSQVEYIDPRFAPKKDINNLIKELEKAKAMLPQQEVTLVSGFIEGNSPDIVAQVTERGKTLVSFLAPGGAVYHETFHQVEEFILDKDVDGFDKNDLYKDVRSLTKKDLTDDQASEYLAEEFRMLTLDPNYKKEIYGPKSTWENIKNFFRKLKALLKGLLGLDNNLNELVAAERVSNLFRDIQANKFAKRNWNKENKDKKKNMSYLPDGPDAHKSAQFTTDLMSSLSRALSDIMFYDPKNPITITDLEMLSNPLLKKAFSEKLSNAYDRSIMLIQQELVELAEAIEEDSPLGAQDPKYLAIVNDLEYIDNNQDAIIEKHRQFLNTVGLDYAIEDATEIDETNQGADIYNEFSSVSRSSITTANPIIKILMATLPSESINSLGLEGVQDYHYTMRVMHKELAGLTDIDQMWAKIQDLQTKYPWAKELASRLGDLNTKNPNTVKLQTMFFDQFFKHQLDYLMYLDDTSEQDLYPINPNRDGTNKQIIGQWKANLLNKRTGKIDQGLIRSEFDGDVVISLDHKMKLPFLQGKGVSIRQLQDSASLRSLLNKDINNSLDFLEQLGFEFTDRNAMIATSAKLHGKTASQIIKDAVSWIITELKPIDGNEKFAYGNIFDPSNLDAQGKIAELVELEMLFNTNVIELRHLGPDGRPRYGIMLNNYFTLISNTLNSKQIPRHLDPNYNPYMTNSLTIKNILEGKGKISVGVVEGKTLKDYNSEASLTNELSPAERLQMKIDMVLRGFTPILRTADSKLDFYANLPFNTFKNFNDARDVLLAYLEDEIVVSQARNKKGYGKKIATFKDKAKGLRVFGKIMRASKNKKFKTDLDAVLKGDISTAKFFAEHEQEAFELIVSELKDQGLEIKRAMIENRILDSIGTTTYENNGLSKQILKLFANKISKYDSISETQATRIAEAVALNWFVGVNEQIKLFFFDLAQYDTFFKRSKGAGGTGNHPRVDAHMLAFLNDTTANPITGFRSKRYDNKTADGTANIIITQDPVTESIFAEQLKNRLDEEYGPRPQNSDYAAINEADANGISNIHFYRDILRSIGNEWSDVQEAAYQKLFRGGEMTDAEFAAVFPTQKFQYFGPQQLNGTERLGMMLKFTVTPINPSLGKKTKLGDLISKMDEKGIDLMAHPSAAKTGHMVADGRDKLQRAMPLYDEQGEFNVIPKNLIQNINLKHFKVQVKMAGPSKTRTAVSTQARSIFPTNIYDNGNPINEELSNLEQALNRANNGYTRNLYHNLLERFGFKLGANGKYKLGNIDQLIEFIQDEMMKRDYPDDMVEGLNLISELKKAKKNASFDILTNKGRIETLLFSIIGKNAIKQKVYGDSKTQVSSMGMGAQARIIRQNADGYHTLVGSSDHQRLNFYEVGPEGTLAMGILVPHQFKEYFKDDMIIGRDGNVYNSEGKRIAGPELLEGIGLRIPVDDLHSIDFFVIKGFLPQNAGNIVVTPPELLVKQGSDNDGDKFTMYLPAYRIKTNGTLVKRKFIDVDTNNKEELGKLYDEKFGPTLEYFEHLKEIIKNRHEFENVNDYQTNRIVQRLMESIFGEMALMPEGDPQNHFDLWGLMDAFNNNDLDYVFDKWEELKTRVDAIPSKTDWVKENLGKDIFLLNHPGAIQNLQMDLQKKILSHPNNYGQLINPVTTKQAKDLALEIREAKGEPLDKSQLPITDLISFLNNESVANEHWIGLDSLGIAAVNFTSHRKFQKAGVEIPAGSSVMTFQGPIKAKILFEGFTLKEAFNKVPIKMGRILDLNGDYITDSMHQIGNAFADVSKDPFVFDLNFTTKTSNTLWYLLRAGIPMRTAAMFLNQPIILDLIKELSVNESRHVTLKAGKRRTKGAIVDAIRKKYEALQDKSKQTRQPTLFNAEQLKEMIGDPTILSNKQISHQLQILDDYLDYDALGSELSNATNGLNYDTTRPLSRDHARLMRAKRQSLFAKGALFTNLDKIINDTHVGEFVNITEESINLFDNFFLANDEDIRQISGLNDIFNIFSHNNVKLSMEDKARILMLAENDLITAVLGQVLKDASGLDLSSRIDSLFRSNNSIPVQAERLRNSPKYRDNEFLKALIPVIEFNRTDGAQTTDNLKLINRITDTYQSNMILDSFKELPVEFQDMFIEFAILQSGLSNTRMSLLKFVPNDMYVRKAVQVATELGGKKLTINNPVITNFFDNFFKNNFMNRKIVPLDWKNKNGHYPYHAAVIKSKYKGKPDIIVLKARNAEGNYVTVIPKGNQENLKEYTNRNSSIIKKHNKIRQPKSISGKRQQALPTHFSKKVAELKEKFDKKSKKCN